MAKQDDIKKKLANDGGSIPSRVETIQVYKDFNTKFQYLIRTINDHYSTNPYFYMQRHEFNAIRDIVWKDSVWCVNAPAFDYNGKKQMCENFVIDVRHAEMTRLNKTFVFHNIGRRQDGDLQIIGKYL